VSPSPEDRATQLGIDVDSLEPLATCVTRLGLVEVRAGTVNERSLIAYGTDRWWDVMFLESTCVTPEHLTFHASSSGGSLLARRVFKPFRPGQTRLWPVRHPGQVNWVVLAGCPSVRGVAVDGRGLHAMLGLATFAGCRIGIFAPRRRIRRLAITAYGEAGQILQRVRVAGWMPQPWLLRPGRSGSDL
jgi:hypothetical protein